jgi:hypothetical protein
VFRVRSETESTRAETRADQRLTRTPVFGQIPRPPRRIMPRGRLGDRNEREFAENIPGAHDTGPVLLVGAARSDGSGRLSR